MTATPERGRLTDFASGLRGYRLVILLLIQIGLIVLSNQAAFWLRFDGEVPSAQRDFGVALLPLLLLIRLVVFLPFRLHQGVWRYAGIWDLRAIIFAVCLSSVAFWSLVHGVLGITMYPRSVFIMDAILLIVLMGGVLLARRTYDAGGRRTQGKRVLVYGAGHAGEQIVRDMLQDATLQSNPIGFIDDDPRKIGQRIHGVPVLGGKSELGQILAASKPEEVLIAIPAASRDERRSIVRALEPYQLRITTLPRLQDLDGARIEIGQIRRLQAEDLLARDPVGLDHAPVRRFLEGRRVVVTGAGGSIGSELCRQIVLAQPACLVMIDRYENGIFQLLGELSHVKSGVKLKPVIADVTDETRIRSVFEDIAPQVVFHAAAHKHVPLMEENPCEAVKNNVRGTRIVAEAALGVRTERFVLISTDKAVHPSSVMGSTKRIAEYIVHSLNQRQSTRFTAVRFGNVLGSSGSVVPIFQRQIASGGPVTVTHPQMRRFFMLIPEAVQLVLHAAALRDHAPLLVLDMGEPVNVAEMAREMIRLAGYVPDKDIAIEYTGIRPGEKLVEHLIATDEVTEPSAVDKILIVTGPFCEDDTWPEALRRLEQLAASERSDETRRELTALLTRFCGATPTTH